MFVCKNKWAYKIDVYLIIKVPFLLCRYKTIKTSESTNWSKSHVFQIYMSILHRIYAPQEVLLPMKVERKNTQKPLILAFIKVIVRARCHIVRSCGFLRHMS